MGKLCVAMDCLPSLEHVGICLAPARLRCADDPPDLPASSCICFLGCHNIAFHAAPVRKMVLRIAIRPEQAFRFACWNLLAEVYKLTFNGNRLLSISQTSVTLASLSRILLRPAATGDHIRSPPASTRSPRLHRYRHRGRLRLWIRT